MSDIKIKNSAGEEVVYNGIDKLIVPLADGSGSAEYSEGGGGDTKEIEAYLLSPDFNQITNYANDKIITLKERAFNKCSSLLSVELLNCEVIKNQAFYGCSSLTSIIAPKVTLIESGVFDGCYNLGIVSFPSVETVWENGFSNSGVLTVHLNSAKDLYDAAFAMCYNLEAVTLSEIGSIGYGVFDNCNSFVALTINNTQSVCSLIGPLFSEIPSSFQSIFVPADLVDAYKADDKWSQYAAYIKPIV